MRVGMSVRRLLLFGIICLFIRAKESHEKIFFKPGIRAEEIQKIVNEITKPTQLHFSQGIFKLARTIELKGKSFISIVGDGFENTEIILADKDATVFSISSSDNILIQRLHARHERPIQPGEFCTAAVISIWHSHDINLNHLDLDGSGTVGVSIYSSQSIRVTDSALHNNSVSGISIRGDIDDIKILRNRFYSNPESISLGKEAGELRNFIVISENNFDVLSNSK